MEKTFCIGGFLFRMVGGDDLPIPPNFLKFETDAAQADYTYELSLVDRFDLAPAKLIARWPDLLVFETEAGEGRVLGVKGMPAPYAVYQELAQDRARILVHRACVPMLAADTIFTSLFALEKRMLAGDALVLHCAYMRHNGEAILFSAPSETGKTTQANLWGQYRGSETVNGDRGLLQRVDGRWTARGWPVCGSSGVCYAEDTPIRAIVMLSQGKTNTVERLSPAKAFSLLYSQITINSWNKDGKLRAIELIERLIADVPVYHLSCTISEEAVNVLEAALY